MTTPSGIIIKADSDDIALPGRLAATLAAFEADPSCRLVTSNAVVLAEDGRPVRIYNVQDKDHTVTDPRLCAEQHWNNCWLGATAAFHRSIMTAFPPMDTELFPYGLDIVLPLRATLLGSHRYLARPLVGWRNHSRNTHRAAGVGDATFAGQERYAALHLMALAQRVRDAKHARLAGIGTSGVDAAIAGCQDTFSTQHDNWCRLRTRLAASPHGETAPFPLPPGSLVVSLEPGHHAFGSAGRLGAVAATWSGFHMPEARHIWTAGVAALLVFRTLRTVRRLIVTLLPSALMSVQQVHVSAGFGPQFEVSLTGDAPITIEVPLPDRWRVDHVVLMIETPDACQLQDPGMAAKDPRLFGVMLVSLELDLYWINIKHQISL